MSAQQISAEDLLPMDTRPAQCTSRKKLQNALFAVNTQQLCNYASQSAQISGQESHLSFKRMPNGSKSNNEICNRANQLNYNLANTSGLRRCLSSTPVLSSPEPVSSSGYCSSTTSNTAIGGNPSTVEAKLAGADDKQTEKRSAGEPKVKYSSSIDSYHNSNTSLNSLNSCDAKALIKSESSGAMSAGKLNDGPNGLSDDLTRQTNEEQQQCPLSSLENNKETPSNDKQSIRYPASGMRKARSSVRKSESLIEKSHIPTISPANLASGLVCSQSSNQPSHRANQQLQTKNRFKTPNDRICRNAFGFMQTSSSKSSTDKPELKPDQSKSDQIKPIRSNAGGHQLSSLNSKRNLATSLSSLPTNNRTPTMLPVLKPQQPSARIRSATTSSSAKINRTRSQSIQNVNVQSSNFGFNSGGAKSRPAISALSNRSKQYNSSTSLNSAPAGRSKKLQFSSPKTSSTNCLNNLDTQDFASTGTKIRYQNYLSSSQHITNQQALAAAAASEQSDLESSTSSKFSNESNPVSKLRRPSLRAF